MQSQFRERNRYQFEKPIGFESIKGIHSALLTQIHTPIFVQLPKIRVT